VSQGVGSTFTRRTSNCDVRLIGRVELLPRPPTDLTHKVHPAPSAATATVSLSIDPSPPNVHIASCSASRQWGIEAASSPPLSLSIPRTLYVVIPPPRSRLAEAACGETNRECLDYIVVFGEAHLRFLLPTPAITTNSERICRWTRILRLIGRSTDMARSPRSRSSVGFIISTAGYSFRQGQRLQSKS
jgi:hypothetical protein